MTSKGNMGKVFQKLWEPNFGPVLELTNFAQMMSLSSGGVEARIDWHLFLK